MPIIVEYPPNMGHGTRLGCEDTMCWMTVGTVRLFNHYYLRGNLN